MRCGITSMQLKEDIPQEILQSFILSMLSQMKATVKAHGGSTCW